MVRSTRRNNNIITHYKAFVMFFSLLISFLFCTKVYALDIKATNISLIDKSSTARVDTPVMINGEISSNITFNNENDYAIFNLTIANNESDKFKIESITDNNRNGNITINYDYSKDYFNGNTNVRIKFLYKNKLINKDKIDIEDLTIKIKLINEKGQSSDIIIINPTTGDNVLMYLIFLILAVSSFILIHNKTKIKGVKVGFISLFVALLILPLIAFAVERFEVPIKFKFIEIKGEFETYNVSIEGVEDRNITYGEKVGTLPNQSKEGYTFNGYVDQNNRTVTENTIVTGPMTIKPKFTAINYNITYNYDGGSASNPTTYTIEDVITLNNPTKTGYTFSGWTGSNGDSLQTSVTITNLTGDLNFTAHYSVNENTAYKVKHRYQNLNLISYTEVIENLTGATGSTVRPQVKSKTGFTSPSEQDLTIKADGTSELIYTYTRNEYALTLTNIEDIETTFTSGNYLYETEIKVKAKDKPGYTFSKWSNNETAKEYTFELTENTEIYPIYVPNTDTPYTVIHKKMNLDGSTYTEVVSDRQNLEGTTGEEITPAVNSYTGFTSPSTQTITIKADGTTVVEYLYTRNKYTLTITSPEYTEADKSGEYYYETEITVKAIDRAGYVFTGWENGGNTKEYTFNITDHITLKPTYEAGEATPYTVIHKKMNMDGSTYTIEETENLTGVTDREVTPAVNTYTGFTSPSTQTVTIASDGSTVVEYLYTRNKYILTIINPENVESDKSGEYYYESEVTLTAKDKTGYTFNGWSNGKTTNSITITILDHISIDPEYTANKYNVVFNSNTGTGSMDNQEMTYDQEKALSKNIFTKTGYTFAEWNTSSDGTGTPYEDEEEVENLATSGNVILYAQWIANTNTAYKVIHKYEKLDGTYEEEVDNLTGTTDASVTPAVKGRTGFTSPSAQTTTIASDGSTVVTYVYDRERYTFEITDRTYIDSTSTVDGTYPYGTEITVKAIDRAGYSFKWNDNSTNKIRTFSIEDNISLTPVYTPNTDTAYTVKHMKQKLTLDGYEIEETENLTGTTDSSVTPGVKTYTGFTSPSTQTVTINGDGSTVVTYNYDREIYVFTLQDPEYVDSTKISGEYPYGTKITISPKTRTGYTFTKWSDNNTDTPRTISLSSDLTIGPVYEANELDFNGDSTISKVYSTSSQTFDITPASNGSGNYTYTITEGNTSNYFSISGTTITIGSSTPAGEYTIKIKATDTITSAEKEATFVITITKQKSDVVTNMSVTPEGVVSFTNSSNADGYLISIDGINYTNVFPGTTTTSVNYLDNITAVNGTRTIYVKATNSDGDNYEESDPVTLNVTVYELSISVNNDDYGSVTESSINVISGATFTTSGSILTISDGRIVTTSKKDLTGYTTTFTGWSTNTGTINQDTSIIANYTRVINSYTVTFDTDGGSTVPSQIVDYGSKVTKPNNPTKTGYIFDKWYTDNTYAVEFDFENTTITGTTTIYGKFNELSSSYTVTFDTDGGSSVSDIIVNQGESIDTLPTTTKENYIFDGWYEDLTDTNPVSEPYTPSGDIELKAKWTKIICKKGTSLYTDECHSANGSGCRMKYNDGDTVTYGNIVSSDTFTGGDALVCDVDGTGYNEKFYYLRTVDNKAVLMHNKTMVKDSDSPGTHYLYNEAINILPSTSSWNQLPTTFDYNGVTKAARFPTLDDITGATGVTNLTASGALKNYSYLFEDIGKYTTTSGRSTVWLESDISSVSTIYRLHVSSDYVNNPNSTTSQNCVKPVIEVPINLISDDYVIRFNPNGGTMTNEFVRVNKGSSLGTLPTPTRADYIFDGWYTSLDFTTKVNESTKPNGYITYYAKWIKTVQQAIVNSENIVVQENDTSQLGITNSSEIEPYTLESNDTSIATIDQNGIISGVSVGQTTITITGTLSHLTKTINVRVVEEVNEYTVSFDSQGGSAVSDMYVQKNTALGSLPTPPTKSGYDFIGWYTNTSYSVEVTVDTVITNDVTFVALWIPENAVAEVNNRFYNSIQAAIDDNTETTKTVKVLRDVTLDAIIDLYNKNLDKNIVLDLNGHTITNNTTQVIRTKTMLEIKNGTIICGAKNGAIDVGINGHLIMNSGRVEHTATGADGRAAVYNEGGTIELGGSVYLTAQADGSTSTKRATVQNVKGNLTITGGTIISTRESNSYAVTITAGTAVIGTKDGAYDTENLVMQANTNGIYANVNFSLYDGMVLGKTAAINNESKITSTEDNATKVKDTDDGYNRLYYTLPVTTYRITLDPNFGEVTPTYKTIDIGDQVGTLPTPTRGIYTFDGWYTGLTDGVQVQSTDVPTGNVTYYARWHYEASNEVINFNMNSDALDTYFSYINSWKNETQTVFQTNMTNNFNANNCSACDDANSCDNPGTGTFCEQSKGYETGVDDNILVFESDETTKQKGNPVSYTTTTNGTIYNMIPGETYYWESSSDSTVHGLVKASGNRRTIKSNVRNVRDIGGLQVDTDNDGTIDGTIKYGKIFRGAKLSSSSSDVTELTKLGITEEVDLRGSSSDAKLSNYKGRSITNYLIYDDTYPANYAVFRQALVDTMQDIINGENIYFHCAIGTDRTGTMAYFLEGLLGVSEEDRVEDYELSYFSGLLNRDRYHDNLSGSSINPRFTSMHNKYPTNNDIYNYFMSGSTNTTADQQLINDFRTAMINYN